MTRPGKIHGILAYGSVIRTGCGLVGWSEKTSTSEFTTAAGNIFEATGEHVKVNCVNCLKALKLKTDR